MTTETVTDTINPKVEYGEKENDHGCPVCGSEKFERDSSKGETFCLSCGTLVDEDKIDTSKEYRSFDGDSKKERAGSSITYTKADKGMGTKIGQGRELNKLSGAKRTKYYRMKKWDRRSDSRKDSVQKGLTILNRLSFDLNLPDSVKEEAGRLYEKSIEEDLIKGKQREAAVAALIYLVARNHEVPRTQKEIAEAARVKTRKMNTTYRSLARDLDLRIRPAKPENFVPRYGSMLGFKGETVSRARNIVKEAREKGITSGKSPVSVAAGGLYLDSLLEGEDVTQKELADTLDVTNNTIRKMYRQLAEELNLEEELEEVKN